MAHLAVQVSQRSVEIGDGVRFFEMRACQRAERLLFDNAVDKTDDVEPVFSRLGREKTPPELMRLTLAAQFFAFEIAGELTAESL